MKRLANQILSKLELFHSDVEMLKRDRDFKIDQKRYNISCAGKEVNLFSQEMVRRANGENLVLMPFYTKYYNQNIFNISFVFGSVFKEISAGEIRMCIIEPYLMPSATNGSMLIEIDSELSIYRTNNYLKHWFVDQKVAASLGRQKLIKTLKFIRSFNYSLENNITHLAKIYLICNLLDDYVLLNHFLCQCIFGISGWHENRKWLGPLLTGNTEKWSLPPICKEFDFMPNYSTRICFTDISQMFDKTLDKLTFKLEFHETGYVCADSEMLMVCALKEIKNLLKSRFRGKHSFLNREMLEYAVMQNPACLREIRTIAKKIT